LLMSEEPSVRYWDEVEWTWYIKDHILPLYSLTDAIYRFWLRLREFSGRLIASIKENEPNLLAVFLGGTEAPGKYSEKSFAKICNRFFGTTINLKDYYSALKLGVDPKVPCTVERSAFIQRIEWLRARRASSPKPILKAPPKNLKPKLHSVRKIWKGLLV